MKKKILSLALSLSIVSAYIPISTYAVQYDVDSEQEVMDAVATEETSEDMVDIEIPIEENTVQADNVITPTEEVLSPVEDEISDESLETTLELQSTNDMELMSTSGACGDNLTWTLDDNGTLTISGKGDMYYYYYAPWYSQRSNIQSVVIESGVTSIGESAFSGCISLTSVMIPDSVTSIGESAFYSCNSLTSITIPDSVTSIGDLAFRYCGNLTSVTIPDSVTNIGYSAFDYCYSLESLYIYDLAAYLNINFNDSTSNPMCYAYKLYIDNRRIVNVEIPDGVMKIPDCAFNNCDSLKNITIPDTVTSIGDYAFRGCNNLTSVTIPDSVTSISDYAFSGCSSLTSVTIPDSVTTIGESAFRYCGNLTSVTIPDSVKNIGSYAFEYCNSLTNIIIPDSVTSIDDFVFANCVELRKVTIPDSVTSIGDSAFSGCRNLTSVTIPDSVITIGDDAFGSCSSLKSLTIPNSVMSIEENAFKGCNELININYNASKVYSNLFSNSDMAFVVLGDNVTTVDRDAFSNCSELRKIYIPKNVTEIEQGAFNNCTLLSTIEYGGSQSDWNNTYIGSYNDSLINAIINYNSSAENAELTISDFLVYRKNNNNTITITDCYKNVSNISIPEQIDGLTVTSIYFENNYRLNSVIIPNSVTSIGSSAFFNCVRLRSITIPDSVTTIDRWAFANCSNLKDVYYTGTESEWNSISIHSEANGYLKNANIHYNSVMPTTTVTMSKTDTTYDFEVETTVMYDNSYVYAAIYDANGILLSVDMVPLKSVGITTITTDITDNGTKAKVFIWKDIFAPIDETTNEFDLI